MEVEESGEAEVSAEMVDEQEEKSSSENRGGDDAHKKLK